MDTAPIIYDLTEQLERIAGALEKLTDNNEKNYVAVQKLPDSSSWLSKFFETLPNWNYNCLRQKLLPLSVAAKIIGISENELEELSQNGRIKSTENRFDLLSLLMWLDEEVNPSFNKEWA